MDSVTKEHLDMLTNKDIIEYLCDRFDSPGNGIIIAYQTDNDMAFVNDTGGVITNCVGSWPMRFGLAKCISLSTEKDYNDSEAEM